MPARFNLEQYERHRRKGLVAYRRGDREEARYQFMKAAESLYALAKESTGMIKETRIESARKLVEMAKDLPERREPEGASRVSAKKDEEPAPKPKPVGAAERPGISFEDIAGLDDVKEQIRIKMIYPFLHPEKAKKYKIRKGGGILLYGPPGTGKTMIAKAIAAELDAAYFSISPSDILNKWVGESEKNISKLFEAADAEATSVIFIDEVESLTPKRRDIEAGGVMTRVVPQILGALDGFDRKSDRCLLFVGATNEPWEIDSAILRPGRLDEKVYVGLPDRAARRKILDLNLADVPLEGVDADRLADRLEGYSGADVAYLCRKVCESIFQKAVKDNDDRALRMDDFESALAWLKPSVSPAELERFETFRKAR